MASSSNASWQIDGETMETVTDFIFLGSKITVDDDYTHEMGKKKKFAPWEKSYDKLSVLKSRDIRLPTQVLIIKAVVFPVVMYTYESWTKQKAEQRIDDVELWC